jgi:hypothetical protein
VVIREEGDGFKDNAGTVGFFLGGGTFKLNSKREIYIYIRLWLFNVTPLLLYISIIIA